MSSNYANRKRRNESNNNTTTTSSSRSLMRQNPSLAFLHNESKEPTLPFDLNDLVSEYAGGSCSTMTNESKRCLSLPFGEKYHSEELGDFECADYCKQNWTNWLLPVLTTTMNDDSWVQIGQEKDQPDTTFNYPATDRFKVRIQPTKRLDYNYTLEFVVHSPIGVPYTITIIYGSDMLNYTAIHSNSAIGQGYKYKINLEMSIHNTGPDQRFDVVDERDQRFADGLSALVTTAFQQFFDYVDVPNVELFWSDEAMIQPEIGLGLHIGSEPYFEVYYSDTHNVERAAKNIMSQFYTSLIQSLRSFAPTRISINLFIQSRLWIDELGTGIYRNDPCLLLVYPLHDTIIDAFLAGMSEQGFDDDTFVTQQSDRVNRQFQQAIRLNAQSMDQGRLANVQWEKQFVL